jgi:hypothetical protein
MVAAQQLDAQPVPPRARRLPAQDGDRLVDVADD